FERGQVPDVQSVADAMLTLLREFSRNRPVLVIVDDLQSMDPATLATVDCVIRGCQGCGLGVLAAYRAGAPLDRGGLTERELGPLTDAAATVLLEAGFPTLSTAARRRVLDVAHGNPLALLELPKVLDGVDGASDRRRLHRLTAPLSVRYSDWLDGL